MVDLLNYLFSFVIITSKNFNIDESHSLKHSMDVFYYSNKIYEDELNKFPALKDQRNIIYTSSILHDMCDKKYMDEEFGLERIYDYMKNKISNDELDMTLKIISSMSYSTVKKNGFPDLGEYQTAYNIVREADLLTSYDFDRCINYQMLKNNQNYEKSFLDATNLFNNRVLKYRNDNLFLLDYSKCSSLKLEHSAIKRIKFLSKITSL